MANSFRFVAFHIVLSFLILVSPIHAAEGEGAVHYDLGVFSFESGDSESAERHLLEAVEADPENPYYLYSLGRVYLKTEKYEKALPLFEAAMEKNPEISGLRYDTALALYKLGNFEKAAGMFKKITNENSDDAISGYHAGMSLYKLKRYDEAPEHLERAAQLSPTLRPHCRYTAGICRYKTDRHDDALKLFSMVVDDPEAGDLGKKAEKWIDAVNRKKRGDKSWNLYARLGFRYDDNVRLDPLDKDLGGDESDWLTVFNFSGKFKFLNTNEFTAGAGYVHYQTMHGDLGEFDLMGSMPKLFAQYNTDPFRFKLTFSPSYYRLDSESYMRRYELKPEAFWKASDRIAARLAFRYSDDENKKDDGESGDLTGFFLDARTRFPGPAVRVFAGAGWENFDANRTDESWKAWKAKAGASFELPKDIDLSLVAEATDKKYDAEPGCECDERHDRKWRASLSVSRHVVYDWLRVIGEYDFTKRESNYVDKQYERNKITVSMAVRF